MIQVCKDIRKEILRISKLSGHGHIPTCFSVVEILYSFYKTMPNDPRNPNWKDRDVFILSKGHASLAHYVILAEFGYFSLKEVETFGSYNSNFGGHADRLKIPGIEASTGSLGHGIGLAVGIALANKILKITNKVYVLIGDGESNEGSVWEAIMVAVNLNLNNLTIIYDNNMSHSRGLQIPNPAERFRSFGCETTELNGHDVEILSSELSRKHDKVKSIVAHTKKGYGCRTLVENMYAWHRRSPSDLEYAQLIGELDETTV
jgi:transketolase